MGPETLRLCPGHSFFPSCCHQPAGRRWGGQPGREGWLSPVCLPTAEAPATRWVARGVWTRVWGLLPAAWALRPAAWAHVAESTGQDQTGH